MHGTFRDNMFRSKKGAFLKIMSKNRKIAKREKKQNQEWKPQIVTF